MATTGRSGVLLYMPGSRLCPPGPCQGVLGCSSVAFQKWRLFKLRQLSAEKGACSAGRFLLWEPASSVSAYKRRSASSSASQPFRS
jgi:hypothetical protein